MARYIDADNLIDYLSRPTGQNAMCDICCDVDCVDCIRDEVIKNQPIADVAEVKHGAWINVANYGNGNCFGYCSVCRTLHIAENATVLKAYYRFCHWCGAKMDGEAEVEE